MLEIVGIENYEKVHHYSVIYGNETHNEFENFLYDFGFSEDERIQVDTPFFTMEGGYIFLKHKSMKIHLFFEDKVFHMVIDSPLSTKKLTGKLKKYFIFPDDGR